MTQYTVHDIVADVKSVFMYRLDRLTLTGALQYNDNAHDLFEREPYSVRFRPVGSGTIL